MGKIVSRMKEGVTMKNKNVSAPSMNTVSSATKRPPDKKVDLMVTLLCGVIFQKVSNLWGKKTFLRVG